MTALAASWMVAAGESGGSGRVIGGLRAEKNLTQQGLASEVTLAGLPWSRSTVGKVESGQRGLGLVEALAVAMALDVPLSDLLQVEGFVNVGDGRWTPKCVQAAVVGEAGKLTQDEAYWSPALERESQNQADRAKALSPDVIKAAFGQMRDFDHKFRLRWDLESAPWGARRKLSNRVGKLETEAARRIELATRLEVSPPDVVAAVDRLGWQSIEVERDRRVSRDPKSENAAPRTLGALRGHAMREMDAELIDQIEAAATRSAAKLLSEEKQ
jgi:transcriptional regulator with XRE-family HTH domain